MVPETSSNGMTLPWDIKSKTKVLWNITGSAHAANLFSQSAKLVWRSGADAVTSFTLPGTRHNKSFCKLCGSALPNTQIPDLLVIPAGCLDTEISIVPTAHIFSSSKAVWDEGLEDLPKFEGLPD